MREIEFASVCKQARQRQIEGLNGRREREGASKQEREREKEREIEE